MNPISLIAASSDLEFFHQVDSLLGDAYTIDCDPTLEEARRSLAERNSPLAILDLRQIYDGGHTADRWIEEYQARFVDLKLIMLTDAVCPEPLERRAAAPAYVTCDHR